MPDASREKRLLRGRMDALRSGMSEAERAAASAKICKLAGEICVSRLAGAAHPVIGVYMPFRGEADLRPFMQWAWRRGYRIAVPKTDKAARTMSLHPIAAFRDLKPGNWNIDEPGADIPAISQAAIDLLFVPGLAFDPYGGRLGYGGGYYDRFFQTMQRAGAGPLTVGVAYHRQLIDRVPAEPHDLRVDLVITERGANEARPCECS